MIPRTLTTSISEPLPNLFFICETHQSVPGLSYKIVGDSIQIILKCVSKSNHIFSYSFDEYKNKTNLLNGLTLKCQIHPTSVSAGYCMDHKISYCHICLSEHKKKYPNDEIFNSFFDLIQKNNTKCEIHVNNPTLGFCFVCNKSLCNECKPEHEPRHKIEDLEVLLNDSKISNFRNFILSSKESYFSIIQTLYNTALKENSREFEEQANKIKENHTVDLAKFKYKHDQIKQELNSSYRHNFSINSDLFEIILANISMFKHFSQTGVFNLYFNLMGLFYNFNEPTDIDDYSNVQSIGRYLQSNYIINLANLNRESNAVINNNLVRLKNTTFFQTGIYSLCKLNSTQYAVGLSKDINIVRYETSEVGKVLIGHSAEVWRGYLHKKKDYGISLGYDKDIRIWDYHSFKTIAVLRGHVDKVRGIREGQNGNIVTVGDDGKIIHWDITLFTALFVVQSAHNDRIYDIEILHDNRFATAGRDDQVKIWSKHLRDKNDFESVIHFNEDHSIFTLLQLEDKRLVIGGSKEIYVYDVSTFKMIAGGEGHSSYINVMALYNANRLISGSWYDVMKIWDLNTYNCEETGGENSKYIHTAMIVWNDDEIITGNDDKELKKWGKL